MKHVLFTLSLLSLAGNLSAQTLGDVAKREEERRKTAPAAGKVYTADNLKPDPLSRGPAPAPPAAASEPAAVPPSQSGVSSDPDKPAAEEAPTRDEKYWRARIQTERDALQRAETFAEALQSRINALSTDFAARDDPAQRGQITTDRQKALSELDRVKQEIQQHTKAIAAIQEEARKAGAPAGWVR
jgi:hypothetical protein